MENMKIVEYKNTRVITTKQLAEAYGTTAKRISNNFNANKKRYTEGKHYFVLENEEKQEFFKRPEKEDGAVKYPEKEDGAIKASKFYLWTQRGALLIAKSLNTDTAWNAYERLVDFYFDRKDEKPACSSSAIPTRSTTALPRRSDWFSRNRARIKRACEYLEVDHRELYHRILKRLNETFDLKAAEEIYKRERGFEPEYAIDIVGYFPELEKMSDRILDEWDYMNPDR